MRPVDPARRLLDAIRSAPASTLLELEPLDHEASLALPGEIADPALRERVAREGHGNTLFLPGAAAHCTTRMRRHAS